MASRSSNHFLSQNYGTTHRGRSLSNDIGWEQFPEKTEYTRINEDPDQTNEFMRDTVKKWTIPDHNHLLASDAPRRNTYARDRLALREFGARTGTEPWMNPGYDTQFGDKDPRGWSGEIPYQEYRRLLEAQYRRTDFKDDGDYSTTSGGIHPDTLYKLLRSAQNWTKARLKIFETSWEGRHPGGVGVYPDVSKVFKSEYEDTSVAVDGTRMSETFEDPVNRQRATMRLSNMVHGGSHEFRVLSTTDHKVRVAAYGKLLKQAGLINHETQMRLLEDDTKRSIIEGLTERPVRGLSKFMQISLMDKVLGEGAPQTERFTGGKYNEKQAATRNLTLTKDILALIGLTQNEIKIAERASSENRKGAPQAIADLYYLAEVVHRAPISIKMEMREKLMLEAMNGRGLTPANAGDLRHNREQVIVNPKIVSFMDMMTRKDPDAGDKSKVRGQTTNEPNRNNWIKDIEVFVAKTADRDSERVTESFYKSDGEVKQRGGTNKKTHSYKALAMSGDAEANRQDVQPEQLFSGSIAPLAGRNPGNELNVNEALRQATYDNEFGENRTLERHIAPMGTKYGRRQMVDTINYEAEMVNKNKKNPKKLKERYSQ